MYSVYDVARLPKSKNAFVLLSDVRDSEVAVADLAKEYKSQYPDRFDGICDYVYYQMTYTPPYEKYMHLKQIHCLIAEAHPLQAIYKGIVAINVSEWLEHYDEEYFLYLLMFLHDNTSNWLPVLVYDDCNEAKINGILRTANKFLRAFPLSYSLYSIEKIERIINDICAYSDYKLSHKAVNVFAKAICINKIDDALLIESLIYEIMELFPKKIISDKDIENYFSMENTQFSYVAVEQLMRGEKDYDKLCK